MSVLVFFSARSTEDVHAVGREHGDVGQAIIDVALASAISRSDISGWHARRPSPTGSLVLRADDSPDERYALVMGRLPWIEVVGWCWGRDGMRGFAQGSTYVIPQSVLRDFG